MTNTIFFVLSVFFITLGAEERVDPFNVSTQFEPDLHYGNVNVISGAYCLSSQDLVVEGLQTISLGLTYNHLIRENKYGLGAGVQLNHPIICQFPTVLDGEIKIDAGGGSLLSYYKEAGVNRYFLDPGHFKEGMTISPGNTGGKLYKASYILLDTKDGFSEMTLYFPNGGFRKYGSNERLQMERLPNGNKIHYRYDEENT